MDPMHSNGSCGTLMSYTDHSVQYYLKSNAPKVQHQEREAQWRATGSRRNDFSFTQLILIFSQYLRLQKYRLLLFTFCRTDERRSLNVHLFNYVQMFGSGHASFESYEIILILIYYQC